VRLKDKSSTALGGILLLLLLLSAVMYMVWGSGRTEQVLFFPEYRSSRCYGEARSLPVKDTKEKDVELLVREVLLGPMNVDLVSLFSRETRLQTILLRDQTLYLDFNMAILNGISDAALSFEEALACLTKTVRFNFPEIREVIYSINGVQPELMEGEIETERN